MLLFGELGEWLGASTTVLVLSGLGFGAQLLFNVLLPDCARMIDPAKAATSAVVRGVDSKP